MMKYELCSHDREWAENIWIKIRRKISAETDRMGDKIPYIPENGKYPDKGTEDISWWTNGFWPGIMWQMYHATGEKKYAETANRVENRLDAALDAYTGLHHDVGFMWLPSAVANYRLTGNKRSLARGRHAANLLAGRYNPRGKFIRAWDPFGENDCTGWIIIDCMMNINLLYWASETQNDPRFRFIAEDHADTAMRCLLRPDGSANHIAVMNPENGELMKLPGGQGYGSGSSWSRGQAWALTGFALSFRHTGRQEYLDAAKRSAHYFIANVSGTGYLPLVDFRAPAKPIRWDTTAGTCAACGLLEIACHVPPLERPLYVNAAVNLLKAIDSRFCNWDVEYDSIVANGTGSYHGTGKDDAAPIIYGDYFLTEAILRLLGKEFPIW
jgi:unsaturated chondroitin disaccharide hydrolase